MTNDIQDSDDPKLNRPRVAADTELPHVPPTQPHDPAQPEPLPLPPDSPTPRAPVTEPDAPQPAVDPVPAELPRLV
jgi:hypothetical protein